MLNFFNQSTVHCCNHLLPLVDNEFQKLTSTEIMIFSLIFFMRTVDVEKKLIKIVFGMLDGHPVQFAQGKFKAF